MVAWHIMHSVVPIQATHESAVEQYSAVIGRSMFLLLLLAFLINAFTWGVLLWRIPQGTETLFLHYNIYFGIDSIGGWKQLAWIPGSGLAIAVLNSVLIFLSTQTDRMIKMTVSILTVAFEVMLATAAVLIILLNTTL